jgi:hypothetical protein
MSYSDGCSPLEQPDLFLFVVSSPPTGAYDDGCRGIHPCPIATCSSPARTKTTSAARQLGRSSCTLYSFRWALHSAAIASQIVSPHPMSMAYSILFVGCLLCVFVSIVFDGKALIVWWVYDSQKARV